MQMCIHTCVYDFRETSFLSISVICRRKRREFCVVMYVCICICIYVYVLMRVCVCACVCVCVSMRVYVRASVLTHTHTYTYTHTHTQTCKMKALRNSCHSKLLSKTTSASPLLLFSFLFRLHNSFKKERVARTARAMDRSLRYVCMYVCRYNIYLYACLYTYVNMCIYRVS